MKKKEIPLEEFSVERNSKKGGFVGNSKSSSSILYYIIVARTRVYSSFFFNRDPPRKDEVEAGNFGRRRGRKSLETRRFGRRIGRDNRKQGGGEEGSRRAVEIINEAR